MDREKQTHEMTKIIARRSTSFRDPNVAFMTTAHRTADSLYKSGYCKKSEVAREIFEEIDQFFKQYDVDENYSFGNLIDDVSELKKKYTEESKNDRPYDQRESVEGYR